MIETSIDFHAMIGSPSALYYNVFARRSLDTALFAEHTFGGLQEICDCNQTMKLMKNTAYYVCWKIITKSTCTWVRRA